MESARELLGGSESEGVRLSDSPGICVYGLFVDGKLTSMAASVYRSNLVVLKMCYTLPEFRRRGHFQKLLRYCISDAKVRGIQRMEATCLPPSIPIFLRAGAVVTRNFLHGKKVRFSL